jgi:hypothetical protein
VIECLWKGRCNDERRLEHSLGKVHGLFATITLHLSSMNLRHALITFSCLNRRSIHLSSKRYAFHDPLSTLVPPSSIPSTTDEAPPLVKKRRRKPKTDAIPDDAESLTSLAESEIAPSEPRRRPRKTAEALEQEPSDDTTSAPPKKPSRRPRTPKEDQHAITPGSLHLRIPQLRRYRKSLTHKHSLPRHPLRIHRRKRSPTPRFFSNSRRPC